MSPLAEKILALLADGYRVEPEDYDCRFVKDAQVMPHGHGGEVRSAVRELADAGLLETACNGSGIAWINDKGREAFGCVHQVNREPSMTTLEIRSWLAPATGECRQQIERLLAHLGELEGQQPREPEPCEHAWFTDPGELHLAVGEKMVVPMPHCSKCGISKAEHVFGPSRDTSQFVACTKQEGQ